MIILIGVGCLLAGLMLGFASCLLWGARPRNNVKLIEPKWDYEDENQ